MGGGGGGRGGGRRGGVQNQKQGPHKDVGKNTSFLDLKSARHCAAKQNSEKKCAKHISLGAVLEVEMFQKCILLRCEAKFTVKICKIHHLQSTAPHYTTITTTMPTIPTATATHATKLHLQLHLQLQRQQQQKLPLLQPQQQQPLPLLALLVLVLVLLVLL